jgi:rSAM/selenodomain-associated transferase 1
MTPTRRHLVLFGKAPLVGAVKRRLAADIGRVPAAVFYRRVAGATLRRLAGKAAWQTSLAVSPDWAVTRGRWWPAAIPRVGQGRGDLGQRMDRALRQPWADRVLLIGTDIPGVDPAHIAVAFSALDHAEVVFGPALDGGFWLVGARRPRAMRPLFDTVRWSSRHALADAVASLPTGLRVAFAETLADVDIGADFERWRRTGI